MDDDLNKIKTTSKKMKMEDGLNFILKNRMKTSQKNGRRPQKKMKMEDDLNCFI